MSFLYKLERRTTETEVENRDELGCTNEVKDLRNELKMLKNSFIRLEGIAVVNVSDITELTSTDNVEGNNENLLHEEVTWSQDICELEAEEKSQTATVTFTCLKCSATFVDRGLLEEHKAEQHTISCPLCTETFDNVDGLNLHMAGFHTPHCATCNVNFEDTTELDLREHEKEDHSGSTSIKCPVCDTECNSVNLFNNHCLEHHSNNGSASDRSPTTSVAISQVCSACDTAFGSKLLMQTHKAHLHSECDICKKEFIN